MWFRDVEVPDELVEAATEGKLVLFVGAGASLDEPSGLPDFANLVRDVGARASRVPTDRDLERPDVFLGDLGDLQIEVHTLVATAINKPDSQPNRLHEAIIDLARVHPNPRVVTTNYDLHLDEPAAARGWISTSTARPRCRSATTSPASSTCTEPWTTPSANWW